MWAMGTSSTFTTVMASAFRQAAHLVGYHSCNVLLVPTALPRKSDLVDSIGRVTQKPNLPMGPGDDPGGATIGDFW